MSHHSRAGVSGGVSGGPVEIFFAYIAPRLFLPFSPPIERVIYQCQGLTTPEISENGPKCLIALEKILFLYIYPVFKSLIYKGKARGAILRPYPIRWHRFGKVALRTRLRASERQVRFVKHFFIFIARGDTLPLHM